MHASYPVRANAYLQPIGKTDEWAQNQPSPTELESPIRADALAGSAGRHPRHWSLSSADRERAGEGEGAGEGVSVQEGGSPGHETSAHMGHPLAHLRKRSRKRHSSVAKRLSALTLNLACASKCAPCSCLLH